MRLYNDAEDQDLLTPGRKVEFIKDSCGSVTAEIVKQTGEGWYTAIDSDGIKWPIKSTHIELIDDGDCQRKCWYYIKSFKGESIQIKPEGYYIDGEDFLIGRSTLDLSEVESIMLRRGMSQGNVERVVSQYRAPTTKVSWYAHPESDSIFLAPTGFVGDGNEFEICEATSMTVDEVSNAMKAQRISGLSDIEFLATEAIKEFRMGSNRRENLNEGDTMDGRRPCPVCGKVLVWMADGSRPRVHKCEPMESVPEPVAQVQEHVHEEPVAKPAGPSVDQVLAAYIKTRDEIAAEKKIFEDRVAGLKKFQEAREKWLAMKMNELGVTNLKKEKVGIAFFKTKSSATIADATQFTDWVMENWEERNHFLERRVSKTAVDEALESGQTQPPGVNYTTIRVVQVQRA